MHKVPGNSLPQYLGGYWAQAQLGYLTNVVFGREFPSKKCGESLSWHILQDTNFFVKWRAENFVCWVNLTQNICHMGYGFPEISNSISGATSLNSIRKECLTQFIYWNTQNTHFRLLSLFLISLIWNFQRKKKIYKLVFKNLFKAWF